MRGRGRESWEELLSRRSFRAGYRALELQTWQAKTRHSQWRGAKAAEEMIDPGKGDSNAKEVAEEAKEATEYLSREAAGGPIWWGLIPGSACPRVCSELKLLIRGRPSNREWPLRRFFTMYRQVPTEYSAYSEVPGEDIGSSQ